MAHLAEQYCKAARSSLIAQLSVLHCVAAVCLLQRLWASLHSMGKPKSSAKKGKSKSKSRSNGPPQPAPTQPLKTSVWQPGEDQMEEDETLAYDPTAYQCLVAFSAEWPCLR